MPSTGDASGEPLICTYLKGQDSDAYECEGWVEEMDRAWNLREAYLFSRIVHGYLGVFRPEISPTGVWGTFTRC